MVIFIPIAYYGSTISPHIDRTPEGYLICRDVPINRTGTQTYLAHELGLDGDPDREVTVYRLEEDVFAPAALASFEGKDITRGHPPEMLTAENQSGYSRGHLEHVRRLGENTVADLIVKDASLVSEVESGLLREVSCGYNCNFEPYMDGYKQTHIIGNHLAIVPRGRAGRDVAIHDATPEVEKGRNKPMSEFWKSVLTAFGMAAKDASPEELDKMVETTATALDAEPVKTPDAEPAKEEAPEEKPAEAADEVVYKEQKGVDLGTKIDKLLELVEGMAHRGERRLHDETDLDEMIEKLSGGGESAITVPVENDCATGPARDAAVELLKKVRPAVAGIQDKETRAKVTDALLSAISGKDAMPEIVKAAMDSAQANAEQTKKTTYEQMCSDSEANYAARNPHNKKEA